MIRLIVYIGLSDFLLLFVFSPVACPCPCVAGGAMWTRSPPSLRVLLAMRFCWRCPSSDSGLLVPPPWSGAAAWSGAAWSGAWRRGIAPLGGHTTVSASSRKSSGTTCSFSSSLFFHLRKRKKKAHGLVHVIFKLFYITLINLSHYYTSMLRKILGKVWKWTNLNLYR